jgi:hypothetical protein
MSENPIQTTEKVNGIVANKVTTTEAEQTNYYDTTAKTWGEIERQAKIGNDPKSQALLELKSKINQETERLTEEGEKFKKSLEDYKSNLKRVDNLMIGFIAVVSIAFITTLSLVFFDLIKEKDLYSNYNLMIKQYYDESKELNKKVDGLFKDFEILKVKNYLK